MVKNFVNFGSFSNKTKIIRFLEPKIIQKTIGEFSSSIWHYSLPINTLDFYRKSKGIHMDNTEGVTKICRNPDPPMFSGSCNDCLISSWSIWKEEANPWEEFDGNDYTDRSFVIASTIGDVRREFEKAIHSFIQPDSNNFSSLIFNAICGEISYYPTEGMSQTEFNRKYNQIDGIEKGLIMNIFHKREKDDNNKKNFSLEKEFRFALILNLGVKGEPYKYMKSSCNKSNHYIKNIYQRKDNNIICLPTSDPENILDLIK